MASDIEARLANGVLDPLIGNDATRLAIDAGNSSADHEHQPPLDYFKILITVAIICICAIPGSVIAWGSISSTLVAGLFEFPYILMIYLWFPESWGFRKPEPGPLKRIIGGIYNRSRMKPSIFGSMFNAHSRLIARIGLLLSWWLVLTVSVTELKKLTLLGSPLWRWSLLAFTLAFAYFVAMFICLIAWIFVSIAAMIHRGIYPYLYSRLLGNTILVLYFGIILGAWLEYFGTDRGLNQDSIPHLRTIFNEVKWICVSLFIGSILWFLKTCVLLVWTVKVIYLPFQPKILMAIVKFMYLGLIAGDFFLHDTIMKMKLVEEYVLHSTSENYNFQKYIKSKRVDIAYLVQASHHLTSLSKIVKPLEHKGLPKLLDYFLEKITPTTAVCQPSDLVGLINCRDLSDGALERLIRSSKYRNLYRLYRLYRRIFHNPSARSRDMLAIHTKLDDLSPGEYRNHIANVLHCILREECSSIAQNHLTFDDLKGWMVDSHFNCVNMGRTLANAIALVHRIDSIISMVISALVAFIWLVISGIATTKILLAVGFPVLAATLLFTQSAKIFFQGVIFCFGIHPFDIGDRCIFDNFELEVEKINILATKFRIIRIGFSKETIVYANSVLAITPIINKGWRPDPFDKVELMLDLFTFREQWKALEITLERFFGDDQNKGLFHSSHEVTTEEIGDKIKVIIHFKHVLNFIEMTHSLCFQKKIRQRSMLLKIIAQFLEPNQVLENGERAVLHHLHL